MQIERVAASNIRRIRLSKRMSQETLAHEAGIDRSYLGALERAEKNPTLRLLSRIATVLDCSIVELVTETDEPEPKNLPRGRKRN